VALAKTTIRVEALAPTYHGFDLIVLHSLSSRTAAPYSQARRLREGWATRARCAPRQRAQGPGAFMLRCGLDSFESDQKVFRRGVGPGAHLVQRGLPQPTRMARHASLLRRKGATQSF